MSGTARLWMNDAFEKKKRAAAARAAKHARVASVIQAESERGRAALRPTIFRKPNTTTRPNSKFWPRVELN